MGNLMDILQVGELVNYMGDNGLVVDIDWSAGEVTMQHRGDVITVSIEDLEDWN